MLLTKDEAHAIIRLLDEFYEGRTLEWDGKNQADPAYTAAVKLAAIAEVPMTAEEMRWATASPLVLDVEEVPHG
jgi:hypothetical protein